MVIIDLLYKYLKFINKKTNITLLVTKVSLARLLRERIRDIPLHMKLRLAVFAASILLGIIGLKPLGDDIGIGPLGDDIGIGPI